MTVYHGAFRVLPWRLVYISLTALMVLNESVFGPMRTTGPGYISV
jgi:hypothetical protein